MANRRWFLAGLWGSLVGGYVLAAPEGSTGAKEIVIDKEIRADPGNTLLVFHAPEGMDEWQTYFMQSNLEKRLQDFRILVIPAGVDVKALPINGAVYHRERIGQAEVEIIANTEEELCRRLAGVLETKE